MPIFEFSCTECGADFEELTSADQIPPCPKCQSANTTRLISACAFQGLRAATGGYSPSSVSGGGGACGGCSGGNCATCH